MNTKLENKVLGGRYIRNILNRMSIITKEQFKFTATMSEGVISFLTDYYFKFQDQGVNGTERTVAGSPFKYRLKTPPASSFKKYTMDKGSQFAIAAAVKRDGIRPKKYTAKFEADKIIEANVNYITREYVDDIMFEGLKKAY